MAGLEHHPGIHDFDIGVRVNRGGHRKNPHESLLEMKQVPVAHAVLGLECCPCDELRAFEDVESVGEPDIAI